MEADLRRTLSDMRRKRGCSGCQCESFIVDKWNRETRPEVIAFMAKQKDVTHVRFSLRWLFEDVEPTEVLLFTLVIR